MKAFPLCLTLLLLLTAWAWGDTRVGLLHVEQGKILLNGRPISAPQLVEQGARLVLEKGARARLQLLGGNTEVTLTGPRTVTVNGAALAKLARPVQRGQVSLAPDIGNTIRGAAITTRDGRKERGFVVETPPTLQDGKWIFSPRTTPLFSDPQDPRRAEWTLARVEIAGSERTEDGRTVPTFRAHDIASGFYAGPEQIVAVDKSLLQPGQRYVLQVMVWYEDPEKLNPIHRYQQMFRILLPQEKALLAELEIEANRRSEKENSVLPLVQLAKLLLSWDQLADVDRVLVQARRHPGWDALSPKTQELVRRTQQALEAIWDRPPSGDKAHNVEQDTL